MSFLGNTATVAAAWAAGALGQISQVKIGDIVVSACEGLSNPSELIITRKVIGTGYPISDAAVKGILDITLDICFANPQLSAEALQTAFMSGATAGLTKGWREKKDALYAIQDGLEIVSTQTHDKIYKNTMVQLIDPVYDALNNWDGFFATVVMTQIKRQSTEEGGLFDSPAEALGDLS